MRAARFYKSGDIRIDEIPAPTAGPGQVGIDIAWCGICGTDLHEYLDGPNFCPSPDEPNPITGETAPVTMGHEMSGVISELGEGVTDFQIGDHVVLEPYIVPEGTDTGEGSRYNLAENANFVGLAGRGGGLSEKVVADTRWVFKVPDSVPLEVAALSEPLSVVYHAYELSGAKEGETALILGAGPIGLLLASVLKAQGIRVIISEPSPLRREMAQKVGVGDVILNPMEDDVLAKVQAETDGKGAHIGFECTSVQVALNTLVDAVRKGGTIVQVAIWSKPASIDLFKLVTKELRLQGTIGYANNHAKTIELLTSGKLNVEPFITGKIGLDDLIDKGFETLIHHNETAIKIIVSPTGKGL